MLIAGIVGAGIMGRLLAFNLIRAGWQVVLFDENGENEKNTSCSQAAAGLLTPISELDKVDKLIFWLGQESLAVYWPDILEQLATEIYFQQTGSIALAHPKDQTELVHFIDRISRRLAEDKNTSQSSRYFEQLTQLKLQRLEPELNKFQVGYYFPQEGHIDNQKLLHALGAYLYQQQITWHSLTHVSSVESFKVRVDTKTYEFDMVFDCRGLGAKSAFADLRSIRGELIWLHAPNVQINRPIRFLHPRYSLYIVPRPQDIYLVGASAIEAEDMSSISVKTALELLTAAYYVHPGFGEARILRTVTHCRPVLSHHLPRIKVCAGLIAINGLYRHGYLIAPAIAHEVLQWLNQGISAVAYPTLWEMS